MEFYESGTCRSEYRVSCTSLESSGDIKYECGAQLVSVK